MKTPTYLVRPVTDSLDIALYWEFVRTKDDLIVYTSSSFDYIIAFADGYTMANNSDYVIR